MKLPNDKPIWERPVRWPDDGLPFDMRPFRFVLAAAEQMSFSQAAQALDTRVSTVSRRVRELEENLGVGLFERSSAGVRLTGAGTRFVDEIIPAIQRIEMALHHVTAAGRAEDGAVRIGVLTTLAGGFMRDLIAVFEREFPGVFLDIRTGGRRDHLSAIRAREIDIAFFSGNAPLSDCDVLELWRERIHVVLAENHRLADRNIVGWSDIRDERFIATAHEPGPEVHDYIIRRSAGYTNYPDVTYRSVDQETLMHMVGLGQGITVVSEGWTNMTFPGLALIPLTAPEDIVPFSAVWSPDNDNPALRRFISFAKVLASKRSNEPADQ